MTDDQGARKLAENSLDMGMVQTTPHLFGWLFCEQILAGPNQDALAHLFHRRFCPAENVPDEKKPYVTPAYFVGWLEAHLDLTDADEICEAAEVAHATWEKLCEMVHEQRLYSALVSIWFICGS